MQKNYVLKKVLYLGLEIYKIIYDFKIENTSLPTRYINIILHHTGNTKTIQDIIDLHVKKKHFSSIGYHFLISKSGKIYLSRELKYAGAHTYLYNRNSIGIAFLGNYDKEELTQKQILALEKLIVSLKKNYPIKRLLGHNQAIYDKIRKKYYKENLENIDLFQIPSPTAYNKFVKETTTKILKFHSTKSDINLIKRLKTCPGFNTYKILERIINFK